MNENMRNELVLVVTGANRGVGKGIVELLAKQKLEQPLTIYATSRSGSKADIETEVLNEIRYRKLDIADSLSIETFFNTILSEVSSIDVLINNAAVTNDHQETPALAEETIWNNYGGTRDMCKAFLSQPQLKVDSRIVNITSSFNHLSSYGSDIQGRFMSVKIIVDLNAIAEAYLDATRQGQDVQQRAGWGSGSRSDKVSKALINALTILLANQNPEVTINCCCPGWIDTDMGRKANGIPPKTTVEGARIPARLAIGHLGEEGNEDGKLGSSSPSISGLFFENDTIIDRGWGRGKLWLAL